MGNTKKLFFLVIIISLTSNLVIAQNYNETHKNDNHYRKDSKGHSSKHHIAIFEGATTSLDHTSTGYTVGIDYEYKLSKLIGAGLMGEYVAVEENEVEFGIPIFIHPLKGTRIIASPLLVIADEHIEEAHGHTHEVSHEPNRHSSFAYMLGIGYDFHLGNFSIDPSLNYHGGITHAISYGISLGLDL
jgi:hypothetical protein